MIKLLDVVALTKSQPEFGLQVGDTGTVVDILGDGAAYFVEFMSYDGTTVAVEIVEADAVRLIEGRDMPQVRAMA